MDTAVEVFESPERVVVAPSAGRIALPAGDARAAEGEFILLGESVAAVKLGDGKEVPVCSAFRGWVMGFLVLDGQPIRSGDPIAWMRNA